MLLYLQIKMTIISWHTHAMPSHAVQEENGSPRNPCKLPVILPRISTRGKVIERVLNISISVYERPWSGQSTAVPGFEMILYRVRGSAQCARVPAVRYSSRRGTPPRAWAVSMGTQTHPSTPLRTSLSALPGNRGCLQGGTDPALLPSDFHGTLTFTQSARNWASVCNVCSFHDSQCWLLGRWFHQLLLHGHLFPAHWKFKHSCVF